MALNIPPGESIFSSVLKEVMPELFTGNGRWANPKNPSLASVLEGVVTGGPEGEFLDNERVRNGGAPPLAGDRASGKTLTLINSACLPNDEHYPGPLAWAQLRERESEADEYDQLAREFYGMNPVPRLCRRCRRLGLLKQDSIPSTQLARLRFSDNPNVRFRPLGTWPQLLLRRHCKICRLIIGSLGCGTPSLHPFLQKIEPEAHYTQIIPHTLSSGERILNIEYGLRKFGVLRMVTDENYREVLRQSHELGSTENLFEKLQDPTSLFYDRNGQVISTELMKNWVSNCEQQHGPDCDASWHSSQDINGRPILVINVLHMCLEERLMSEVRYVALSYVRGNTIIPVTKMENVKQRQDQRSLDTELPATIQDAITLTKRLDERYLWVDALCIVQDDLNSKHSDIKRMG